MCRTTLRYWNSSRRFLRSWEPDLWRHGMVIYTSKRAKVSDCFNEAYRWKNPSNMPQSEEATNGCTSAEPVLKDDLTLQVVHHLERLSLVDFSNEAAITRLSSAIRFADRLKDIDTTGVRPLFSLLESETLSLRNDEVTEGNQKTDVLRNAALTFEDFFVAPPGNVPLEQQNTYALASENDCGNPPATAKATTESSVDLKKAKRKAKSLEKL
ncbi:putative Glutamyl-tRNA(Gln) amidotransferase subunit C, mitochondrial [Hypsibius exemplaris]|uniref:Glutamyl-tRNA(Gln) amidotransferase subunit C, mitochondrial n=1 Tax=Hypsibius exemplaris TaxID=2072580 RepID=A0A9X6NF09_HYPEX|nr:putative Glutamyl-tRNA(Gln) amidotransferase subunit C, mitochondrial [Hypsibius exemplaris]